MLKNSKNRHNLNELIIIRLKMIGVHRPACNVLTQQLRAWYLGGVGFLIIEIFFQISSPAKCLADPAPRPGYHAETAVQECIPTRCSSVRLARRTRTSS